MKNITFIILILGFASCTDTTQIERLQKEIDTLKIERDSLTQSLNKENAVFNPWFSNDYDGRKFKKVGISNPEEFIEKSLRENPGLIPLEAVLGGTMNFRNIQLLGSEWLIAEYDDGHIEGRGIYKFQVNKKGEIEFKLLDSWAPK